MVAAAARFPPLYMATPLEMPALLFSEGELVIATAMSERGFWHMYCRNRDEFQPTFLGTCDVRAQAVEWMRQDIAATRGARQPDDYFLFLMPHNQFFGAKSAHDSLPYFCRPFDPAFAETEAHNAAMFARAERGQGRRRALPEFTTPEARQIEGLLAEIPPGPLREVMAEVSEKLLHRAEFE